VPRQGKLHHLTNRIPGATYLWLAILIFGASSAVTRKLTEIGAQHFVNGQNPISLCNVLFVGNLCALIVLIVLYGRQWQQRTLSQLSRKDWLSLVIVAILSSALAPGLIFQALALTKVNNVVLVGRLEPPLILAMSVWFLRERVNRWEIVGAITSFIGVVLTIFLQPPETNMMQVGGFSIGVGELLVAIAALALAVSTIISKKRLSQVPLGIYSIVRTALGTAVFFVSALVLYGRHHFMDVFSPFLWQWMLAYGVVIVVIGQSLWTTGLRASTVSTVSIVSSFTPIVGIMSAYLVLGEVPTDAQYLGGSVILIGIVLSQVGTHHHTPPRAAKTSVDSMQAELEINAQAGFKGI
jgi:drug/metabolite transporter (DMT)-like permease